MQGFRSKGLNIALIAICFFASNPLNAQSYPGTNNSLPTDAGPPNDPPVWNNIPNPIFTEGFVASYDLAADCADPEDDALTFVNEAGCTLPVGMSIDNINDELDEDGTSPVATTLSCVFSCDDGVNTPVDSSAFSIVVNTIPALGTIYESDMFGTRRTGTSGAVEKFGPHTGNPIAQLNWGVPFTITDFGACDATVTTGDGDWTKVNNAANNVVCIDAGDHTAKGKLDITDGGTIDATINISAVTLSDPARIDFAAVHGWSTDDIVFCNDSIGGTWQLRWRYFQVTVIDTNTVDLQGEDASGAALQPKWTAYTSGGGCYRINFKVIRHSVDLSSHPVLLAGGSQAQIENFAAEAGDDNILLWGLSFPDIPAGETGTTSRIGGDPDIATDHFVLSFSDFKSQTIVTSHFMNIDDDSDFGVFQDLTCSQIPTHAVRETVCINIREGISGTRVLRSEFKNLTAHGVQVLSGADFFGTVIAGNSFYTTTAMYADCDGTPNVSGICACTEKAIEFKDTITPRDTSPDKMIRIEANLFHGFRKTVDENTCSGTSTNVGAAWGTSTVGPNKESVLGINNVAFDMQQGVSHSGSTGNDILHWSAIGNIFDDITHAKNPSSSDGNDRAIGFQDFHPTAGSDDNEFAFNTINQTDHWLFITNDQTGEWTCNLQLGAGSRLGALNVGFTQDENYMYNTSSVEAGDTDGGVEANANMADLTVKPFIITAPATEITLTDVLSTASSPHLNDCSNVGSSGIGVNDDAVTF